MAAVAALQQAVISLDRHVVTATGPGAYREEHTLEVTVFTPAAFTHFQEQYVYFDGSSSVTSFEADVQSFGAKKPVKAKRRDRTTAVASDGFSLNTDGRYAVLQLDAPTTYPATIRVHSIVDVRESIHMPFVGWRYPKDMTLQLGELVVNGDLPQVRHMVVDPHAQLVRSDSAGAMVWRIRDYTTPKAEDYSTTWIQHGPAILLSPKLAKLGGIAGDYSDWAGKGAWTADLLSARETLPPAAAQAVQALVAGVDDPRERVRRVYEFLQKRSHYVSVQLGIGGFQPAPPEEVHRLGYGDCKGLSNYTRLLLKSIGQEAYYCEIGVQDREIVYPEFSSTGQTNHAIVAVPLSPKPGTTPTASDTIWLECTSQTTPAGFLGANAAGRRALLIKDGTGHLVRTSGYKPSDNHRSSFATIQVQANGSSTFERRATDRGASLNRAYRLAQLDPVNRVKIAKGGYSVDVEALEVSARIDYDALGPVGYVTERGQLPQLVKKVGTRLVWTTLTWVGTIDAPSDTLNRLHAVDLDHGYTRVDSVVYVLPKGYVLSKLPSEQQASSSYGEAKLTATVRSVGEVLVVRTLLIKGGQFPATEAAGIARFERQVSNMGHLVISAAPE